MEQIAVSHMVSPFPSVSNTTLTLPISISPFSLLAVVGAPLAGALIAGALYGGGLGQSETQDTRKGYPYENQSDFLPL
jgi:hypothetical protein